MLEESSRVENGAAAFSHLFIESPVGQALFHLHVELVVVEVLPQFLKKVAHF